MQEKRKENKKNPILFERFREESGNKNIFIPEESIYDDCSSSSYKNNQMSFQRSVTVFGYSQENMDSIIRRFKAYGEIKEINYGKNWIDIKYEKEKPIYTALRENGSIINGEMVGVLQKNRKDISAPWVNDQSVLVKKEEGLISRFLSYLFG
ncbi:hypothetical protein NEFER03_1044 [Nematocida sp. LUAm3]|nr:hypothetical protein NEFER03_1044 [Nematocida sp. LUAm3]KAI5175352.1 hypothetical protein NEFER02_1281 [Nematocida sp. LUAm2]KAI5177691.1 hypothetical protein NEFER01_0915 [Nematocida sp. LUAm1]